MSATRRTARPPSQRPASRPPERLVDLLPDIAARDADIAEHAVIEPRQFGALAATPAPLLQRIANEAQHMPQRRAGDAPPHALRRGSGNTARGRAERDGFHVTLLSEFGGRMGSAALLCAVAVEARDGAGSALSGSCCSVHAAAPSVTMRG